MAITSIASIASANPEYEKFSRFILLPLESARDLYAEGVTYISRVRCDAGVDIRFPSDLVVPANGQLKVSLGLKAVYLKVCDDETYLKYCKFLSPAKWHKENCDNTTSEKYIISNDDVEYPILPDCYPYLPWAYHLSPRSSICKTSLSLVNSAGLIDSGYRGELIAVLRNHSSEDYLIARGSSLLQLVTPTLEPIETEVISAEHELAEVLFGEGVTARGAGGFGSTGSAGKV